MSCGKRNGQEPAVYPNPPPPAAQSLSLSKIWLESRTLCLYGSIADYKYTRRAIGPLCEKMTSSTKPEVHNISQRCQRKTEPRPQETYKNLGEFGRVFFRVMRADRQTDKLITMPRVPHGGEVKSPTTLMVHSHTHTLRWDRMG